MKGQTSVDLLMESDSRIVAAVVSSSAAALAAGLSNSMVKQPQLPIYIGHLWGLELRN